MQPQANAHCVQWYDAMLELYSSAAEIGIQVGHIADYYLERWWLHWADAANDEFFAAEPSAT